MKKNVFILLIYAFMIKRICSKSTDTLKPFFINKYLQANSETKKKISKELIRKNFNFDYIFSRLKEGKHYSQDVQKGFFEHNFQHEHGIEHPNLVFISYKYNPEKKDKVCPYLHGGVSSFDKRQIYHHINRIDTHWRSINPICLYPSSWILSEWWSSGQYENLAYLLNFIKENYNIDENDVYITGVSDGATGIYYLSNFYQTPFSYYLLLIGSMELLTTLTDNQFYLRNFQGLSFLIVNGEKDEVLIFIM